MNIGELKHRIRFEQNQKISDGQGGFDSNWVELDKLWAKAVNNRHASVFIVVRSNIHKALFLRLGKIKQSQYQQREIVLICE